MRGLIVPDSIVPGLVPSASCSFASRSVASRGQIPKAHFINASPPLRHDDLCGRAQATLIHFIFTKIGLYRRQRIGWGRHPCFAWAQTCAIPIPKLATPMATTKILLAEDDTDMRRFLVKALQTAGYNVVPFDNGLSAYQRLREEPFELLLTDIVMPEMDGIELARRAAELDPDMKIMFITGFAAVALNPDSAAPKQAKVLSKPFHLRELVSEVGKMLAAA
jgi:two-component system, cell cycle response regulator CpdR